MSSNRTIFLNEPLRAVKLRSFSISSADFERNQKDSFDRGYAEASSQLNEQITKLQQDAQNLQDQILKGIQEKFTELTQEISERLPTLIVSLTRRALGGIELDEEKIKAIIQDNLKEVSDLTGPLTLFLSPQDYELMDKTDKQFASKHAIINFEKDESLSSGDCLIKSSFGLIDGRMDTKLKKVKEELKGE